MQKVRNTDNAEMIQENTKPHGAVLYFKIITMKFVQF